MLTEQLRTRESRLAAAKRDLGLPVVVAICGSMRFMAEMTEAEVQESAAGRIVVRPGCDLKQPHPLWAAPARTACPRAPVWSPRHERRLRRPPV
ncbi:hypothetical protein ACZ90_32415, partial [Streptomyces albus subsp. albus]